MSRCNGCGATIGWALGTNVAHPVEQAEVVAWLVPTAPADRITTKLALVQHDARVVVGWVVDPDTEGATRVTGHESHFAYCRAAKDFRKG